MKSTRSFCSFLILATIIAIGWITQAASAQTTAPASGVSTDPTSFAAPTSIAGVVALTIVIIQASKAFLSEVPLLSKIPIWVYAVVIAAVLTIVSDELFHSLSGDLKTLIWHAILSAASATGFYEWYQNGGKPLSAAGSGGSSPSLIPPVTKAIIMLIGLSSLCLASVGCSNSAQVVTIREGLNSAAQPIFSEYQTDLQAKVKSGQITQQSAQIRMNSIAAFNAIVADSRASNPGTSGSLPTTIPAQ